LKKESSEDFKQILIDLGGLGTFSKCLDHWNPRVRQLSLQCIIPILQTQNGLEILQSEVVLHLASILRYVSSSVEHILVTEILNDLLNLNDPQETFNIHLSLLQNGVMDSLLDILDKDSPNEEAVEGKNLIESVVYCLSNFVSHAVFQPVLFQDHSMLTLSRTLKHHEANAKERAAWILSELSTLNEYSCYYIASTSIIVNIMGLLKSKDNPVVTSALRVVLSVARKSMLHSYLIKADPNLEVLRSLEDHELANVKAAAQKLVNLFSK
jgi:hypothetical protein